MSNTELKGKAVRLQGRKQDLKFLSEQFCFGDFCIYRVSSVRLNPQTNKEEEYDDYYLKSPSFDSKADNWEIYSEAIDIVSLINGEAQLEVAIYTFVQGKPPKGLPDFLPVRLDSTVTEFKEGTQANENILPPTARLKLIPSDYRKFVEALGVEAPEGLKKRDDVKDLELVDKQEKVIESHFPLLELVKSDENVGEALTYYGYEHSWSNLYRTWEVIKKEMGYRSGSKGWERSGFRRSIKGTCIEGNENRFSQTANYNRHGGVGAKNCSQTSLWIWVKRSCSCRCLCFIGLIGNATISRSSLIHRNKFFLASHI